MASKSKSRPASRRSTPFQPQDLILAGIGAVSLGRKKAQSLYAKAGPAARLAVLYARDAQEQGRLAADEARSRVLSFAAKAQNDAQKKLAPVLAKLGIKAKAAAKPRARKKSAPARRRKAA
jgi:formate-dependent nitrite reductase cytochrome c552 subunit